MIAAAGIQNVSVKSEQKQTDQIPEKGKLRTKKSLLIRRVTRVYRGGDNFYIMSRRK
jgi:hypothetical protein